MRRVAVVLAVLGAVAFAADMAVAGPSGSHVTLVRHYGYGPPGARYFGFYGYGGWPGYSHGCGRVIVPPGGRYPGAVYPYRGRTYRVYPSVPAYRYDYYPSYGGFYYRGGGVGVSVTF